MRKQIVEARTKDLPEDVAERLQGFNGTPDEFTTNIVADLIRGYLRKKYGSTDRWLAPLQRMIGNKEQLNQWELEAVKRVIREVDGREG